MASVAPVVLTSLLPPLTLLPGAVCAAAMVRRHRERGVPRDRERALSALVVHVLVMVGIGAVNGVGAIVALLLGAPGWGLLEAVTLSAAGCGVGWWLGSTERWHQPAARAPRVGPGV